MPDWECLVAERLAQSRLTPEIEREVVVEIAAHLEECHRDFLEAGSSDPEAQTLSQVSDWNALCRRIRRSKEDRMNFARKVVMPGLAALIAAQAVLKLLIYLLIAPEPCMVDSTCISVSADGPVYLPWLATLPVAGALAATLARRLGARSSQRLIAALFPAFYLGAETLVISVLDQFFWRIPIYWVIIPAIACALGALPFLGDRRQPTESRPVPATQS
jgi:hypothetical protein